MATLEEEKKQRETLRTVLEALAKIEPQSLVRADQLGKELSFEAGLPNFQRTIDLFKNLSEADLDGVPYEVLSSFTNIAQQTFQLFQRIQNFNVQSNPQSPAAARDNLINENRNQWNELYRQITPVIAYSVRRGTDFDTLEREARGVLALVKNIETDTRTESQKTLAEMQGALEKVRQAAAEAGVAQHAIHFKQEAEAHLRQTWWWLAGVALFGVATIAAGYYTFGIELRGVAGTLSTGNLVVLALSRLIVISVLSYGLVFCARNYASSEHNFVVNRHRQNALSTFETFVKASNDVATKDAVLLQATQSIFAPQTSGYLRDEAAPQHSAQIVEVVRKLMETKP